MSKAPAKPSSDFRARRLSVNEMSNALPESGAKGEASPSKASGGRARRMSMSPEMGVVKPKATLPFPMEIVGTYSCHGVEPGVRMGETSAKINQDRGCVVFPFGDVPGKTMALFCVYDGHGSQGDKVSHYVMNNVQEKLEMHPQLESDPAKALKETFVKVDTDLKKDPTIDAELSGTTAVVTLAVLEGAKMTFHVANAGDSRCVLCKKPKKHYDLSEDQKPDTPAEMKRIKKAGGHVSPPEVEWGGPARVWIDANMTLPGLAMGRSIGDHLVSSVGVIADPEVVTYGVDNKEDLYFVMASDGVWEFIESQPCVDIVSTFIDTSATEACTKLIETAAAKWRQEEGDYRDDITAICVKIPEVMAIMAEMAS